MHTFQMPERSRRIELIAVFVFYGMVYHNLIQRESSINIFSEKHYPNKYKQSRLEYKVALTSEEKKMSEM